MQESAEPVGKTYKEAADLRKNLKTFRSLLYGTGVVSFSENSNITNIRGQSINGNLFQNIPQLSEFFKQSGQNTLKFNYVREPYFGRVSSLTKPKNGMEASHNKMGMDYPPQSTNSSIMKYALCLENAY
jgi:DNA polymerase I-like protein with 3'-5' exonuclease and polymerase domains